MNWRRSRSHSGAPPFLFSIEVLFDQYRCTAYIYRCSGKLHTGYNQDDCRDRAVKDGCCPWFRRCLRMSYIYHCRHKHDK